jgi:hypothetical protein
MTLTSKINAVVLLNNIGASTAYDVEPGEIVDHEHLLQIKEQIDRDKAELIKQKAELRRREIAIIEEDQYNKEEKARKKRKLKKLREKERLKKAELEEAARNKQLEKDLKEARHKRQRIEEDTQLEDEQHKRRRLTVPPPPPKHINRPFVVMNHTNITTSDLLFMRDAISIMAFGKFEQFASEHMREGCILRFGRCCSDLFKLNNDMPTHDVGLNEDLSHMNVNAFQLKTFVDIVNSLTADINMLCVINQNNSMILNTVQIRSIIAINHMNMDIQIQ